MSNEDESSNNSEENKDKISNSSSNTDFCTRSSCNVFLIVISFLVLVFTPLLIGLSELDVEVDEIEIRLYLGKYRSSSFDLIGYYHHKSEVEEKMEKKKESINKCLIENLEDEDFRNYFVRLSTTILTMNLITCIFVFILFIYSIFICCENSNCCCCSSKRFPYHWALCIVYFYGFLEILISIILMYNKKCMCNEEDYSDSCEQFLKIQNRPFLTIIGILDMILLFILFILSILVYKKSNINEQPQNNIINENRPPITRTIRENYTIQPRIEETPVRQINVQINNNNNNNNNFETVKENNLMIIPENVHKQSVSGSQMNNNNEAPPPLPSNEPLNKI